jgi:hypothetical protein
MILSTSGMSRSSRSASPPPATTPITSAITNTAIGIPGTGFIMLSPSLSMKPSLEASFLLTRRAISFDAAHTSPYSTFFLNEQTEQLSQDSCEQLSVIASIFSSCFRSSSSPCFFTATVGITGAPNSRASNFAFIFIPCRSATSSKFSVYTTGIAYRRISKANRKLRSKLEASNTQITAFAPLSIKRAATASASDVGFSEYVPGTSIRVYSFLPTVNRPSIKVTVVPA